MAVGKVPGGVAVSGGLQDNGGSLLLPEDLTPDTVTARVGLSRDEAKRVQRSFEKSGLLIPVRNGRWALGPDQLISDFTLPPARRSLHKIQLSTAQLGSEDMAELRIGVDKTFVPALQPGHAEASENRERVQEQMQASPGGRQA